MHFLRAGFLEIVHAGLAGRPAHDGIVHDDHPFALHQLLNQVELHPHVEIADELRGLEEAAPHIVIAHEGHLERDARFQRVPQRRAVAAVRHGHDDIRRDGELARKLPSQFDPHPIDVPVRNGAVGPGEIDILEDAECAALVFREGLHAAEPVAADGHNLPRFHVAHKPGVNQIQGAGFARQHPRPVNPPEAQWSEPIRVAQADEFVLRHDHQRVGPFNAVQGPHQVVTLAVQSRLRQQMQNDLAIHRGLEDRAFGLQLLAELGGIGQVAVVGDGDLAARAIHGQRLGVAQVR